jgi:hypothetical protein
MHWSSAAVPASPEAAAEAMLLCTLLTRASREELRQAAWSTSAVSSAAGQAAVPGAGALVVQGIAPLPIPCHAAAPLGLDVAWASRLQRAQERTGSATLPREPPHPQPPTHWHRAAMQQPMPVRAFVSWGCGRARWRRPQGWRRRPVEACWPQRTGAASCGGAAEDPSAHAARRAPTSQRALQTEADCPQKALTCPACTREAALVLA